MAVPATAVWEIKAGSTALNVNGAGFDPGNVSMATDLTTDANTANTSAPVCSSASYNFVAGDVGKWLYVQSGTNWTAGWYQIASVASNKATLTAGIGTAIQVDATKGYPSPKYQTNTVVGCATVGTPTGGVWSVDYSQHTAAIQTATDLVIDGTLNTKVTSASRTFGACDVGNVLHITAGTGWTVGWYFIMSVAAGAATLDRSPGAVTITGGTYYEGGAASLNSNTSNQTDTNLSAVPVAGNTIFMTGALTLAATFNTNAGAFATGLVSVVGYTANRGTIPTGSGRPTLNQAGISFGPNNLNAVMHFIATGTIDGVVAHSGSGGTIFLNLKVTCTSTAAGRKALSSGGGDSIVNCEAVSYRGKAITDSGGGFQGYNYAHDSDVGFTVGGRSQMVGNIAESCVTTAISSVNAGNHAHFIGNTVYGAENKLGTGFLITVADRPDIVFMNNIIYGCATAVSLDSSPHQRFNYCDFNDYFNNTTDNTNWYKGPNDQAVNPSFASVSQITGTAGKFTAANDRIVDTTKNFTTLGVVAGRDCIYIVSGTGVTAGIYGVSSIATTTNPNDTLVLDLAPGTSTTADKVYQLTVGHNFAIAGLI